MEKKCRPDSSGKEKKENFGEKRYLHDMREECTYTEQGKKKKERMKTGRKKIRQRKLN